MPADGLMVSRVAAADTRKLSEPVANAAARHPSAYEKKSPIDAQMHDIVNAAATPRAIAKPSPAQCLLPELLADIFLFALSSIYYAVGSSSTAPNSQELQLQLPPELARFPLYVSQVCGAWRGVALGTSRLWSFINVHAMVRGNLGQVDRRCMSFFDTQIQRSEGKPLSIFSSFSPHPEDLALGLQPLMISDVLGSFTKYQRRWQKVHFGSYVTSTYPKSISEAEELSLRDLPLLEELVLVLPAAMEAVEHKLVVDLSTSAHLTRLRLAGELRLLMSGTTLSHLSEVDLSCPTMVRRTLEQPFGTEHRTFPTVNDVFNLLRITPNLEVFAVTLARLPEDAGPPSDDDIYVTLPKMRKLVVQAEGDEDHLENLCLLLDRITAPALAALGIWCKLKRRPAAVGEGADEHEHPLVDWWLNIPELLQRSSAPPLTSFYIDSDVVTQREIRECMYVMPHLRDLTLVHVQWSARGALRLALDPDPAKTTNLAVRLGVLRFVGVRFGGAKKLRMTRVVKMVASRWREDGGERGCLREVVFIGCDVAGLDGNEEIKRCEEEGLKITCQNCI